MRSVLSYILGVGAMMLGGISAAGYLDLLPDSSPFAATLLHITAAIASTVAAKLRTGASAVNLDTVLIFALLVPFLGPAFAWTFPQRLDDEEVSNAHAVFEAYEKATGGETPTYRPAVFTGDFNKDLSRELNTVTYAQILRGGSLEQKRNLLRTLGRRAEPRHLVMIRKCLHDDEQEIRLCAYAEVDRLSRQHEEKITRLKRAVEECVSNHEAVAPLAELAEAQRAYAQSAVLDTEMARFWLMEAEKTASKALRFDPDHWGSARTKAICHAELREFAHATACLDALPRDDQDRPEIILTRAEIAFASRDFGRARAYGHRLRSRRLGLPPWLEALGHPNVDDLVGSRP